MAAVMMVVRCMGLLPFAKGENRETPAFRADDVPFKKPLPLRRLGARSRVAVASFMSH
jgi:hypothetical protein